MNKSQKGESNILVFLLALLLIALTAVTVYYWQRFEREKEINAPKSNSQSNVLQITPEPKTITADAPNLEATPIEKSPVVIYTPGGLFNADEIAELKKKLTDPFIDWHKDSSQNTVSISVEKPYPAIEGYKYKITYINEGGANGGFLYGTATPLEWWLPECLGSCDFSAEFEEKYPEIVAETTP